jgi:hypothetical protein
MEVRRLPCIPNAQIALALCLSWITLSGCAVSFNAVQEEAIHVVEPTSSPTPTPTPYFTVGDQLNNRVLIWNRPITQNQQPADIVLGQPDFVSSTDNHGGISARSLSRPRMAYTDGTKLIVSENTNNRVLIWNTLPLSKKDAEKPADVVLGQPNMNTSTINTGGLGAGTFNGAQRLTTIRGKLYVPDQQNNRLLIWNTIPTSNQALPDLVLGQPNFVSNTANNGGLSAATLRQPVGIDSDGTRVCLTDYDNHRVLLWNTVPTSTQQPADLVLGQPNMNSRTINHGGISSKTLYGPVRCIFADGKLIVSDANNNRVLIWNSFPTSHFQAADLVLGQPNFTSNTANNGGISAKSMNIPHGLFWSSKQLFVVNQAGHRVLIWNSFPSENQQSADLVLGQPDMSSGTANNGGLSELTLNMPT